MVYMEILKLTVGSFRDASDYGKWKLFKGLTSEPTTTVDKSDSS